MTRTTLTSFFENPEIEISKSSNARQTERSVTLLNDTASLAIEILNDPSDRLWARFREQGQSDLDATDSFQKRAYNVHTTSLSEIISRSCHRYHPARASRKHHTLLFNDVHKHGQRLRLVSDEPASTHLPD